MACFWFDGLAARGSALFLGKSLGNSGQPVAASIKDLKYGTDGKQLLKTFSKKQKDVEALQAARFALEALVQAG